MNENHQRLCPSLEWAAYLEGEVLPELLRHAQLGDEMLEIGPGPGASTEWLRHRVKRLVAVEVDPDAAALLSKRFVDTNVEVHRADGTHLDLPEGSFDSVGCFTMLHHVPTALLQNTLLGEALRVLRPGGVLIGSDSLASTGLHHFHADDTYNPVDPAGLLVRLQTLGFGSVTLLVDDTLKFVARKPQLPAPAPESDEGSP